MKLPHPPRDLFFLHSVEDTTQFWPSIVSLEVEYSFYRVKKSSPSPHLPSAMNVLTQLSRSSSWKPWLKRFASLIGWHIFCWRRSVFDHRELSDPNKIIADWKMDMSDKNPRRVLLCKNLTFSLSLNQTSEIHWYLLRHEHQHEQCLRKIFDQSSDRKRGFLSSSQIVSTCKLKRLALLSRSHATIKRFVYSFPGGIENPREIWHYTRITVSPLSIMIIRTNFASTLHNSSLVVTLCYHFYTRTNPREKHIPHAFRGYKFMRNATTISKSSVLRHRSKWQQLHMLVI